MSVPNVRRQTMEVLREALRELVTEPPGPSNLSHNERLKAWDTVKELNALRVAWLRDGYMENNEQKAQIEHWCALLSAVFDPRSR